MINVDELEMEHRFLRERNLRLERELQEEQASHQATKDRLHNVENGLLPEQKGQQ